MFIDEFKLFSLVIIPIWISQGETNTTNKKQAIIRIFYYLPAVVYLIYSLYMDKQLFIQSLQEYQSLFMYNLSAYVAYIELLILLLTRISIQLIKVVCNRYYIHKVYLLYIHAVFIFIYHAVCLYFMI